MKTFTAALIAASMMTAPAYAWDYVQNGRGQQIGDNATGVQNNTSQRQGQAQAQQQRQRQNQRTTVSGAGAGAASNQGNNQTVNVDGGGNGGGYSAHFPVSSAIAPNIMTVNPCGGAAASGALQTGIFGISLGAAVHFDQMCQIAMYSSNPYAFQWACREMDGFRAAALDAYRGGFAPHPCAQDVTLIVPAPAPPPIIEAPAAKRWAVVPCHVPGYRTADGRCHYPAPPPKKPVIVLEPMTCKDLIKETLRECREERR